MKRTLLACCLIFPFTATAENSPYVAERLDDQRVQEMNPPQLQTIKPPKQNVVSTKKQTPLKMTKSEFAKHPDYIIRALTAALIENNAEKTSMLFELYQKLQPQYKELLLTSWAEAILAKAQQQYSTSISLYRQLISEYPDFHIIRLQLAIALAEDHQLEAAQDQFQRLDAEPKLTHLKPIIHEYLTAIKNQSSWKFSGELNYLNDPNINNAPQNGTTFGNWLAPKQESAHGIDLSIALGKKSPLTKGIYNEFRTRFNHKYYWDNKKYNEATFRIAIGFGHQNAKFNLALLPFMEQNWYAGGRPESDTMKRFSKSSGITLENGYWVTPNWQLNHYYEYAKQGYTTRRHLNGNYHFTALGATFYPNVKQFWFGNINYNRTSTRDKDDSFQRYGATIGWGQEWYKGISTQLSLSYHIKDYQAPMPIFLITQHNKELNIQLSLWHRAIHFWEITPRLTYQYTKVHSNHVFYSYDKQRIFIEFSKKF